ncbi:MAG: class II aldolase/adducin family protein [Aliishimia sp.]
MTTLLSDTPDLRQSIIDACLWMGEAGINQGTSGNISVRIEDGMLITPSAIPYAEMTPDMMCKLPIEGDWDKTGLKPSSEWRFHQAILAGRADVHAVVHAHPAYATALATHRKPIPAVHYMVAAFGGAEVPVADYARFGSEALSKTVVETLAERHGCLMANHGAVTAAPSLAKALWLMEELENLARVYTLALTTGTPVILSDAQIAETLDAFAGYGLQD